VIDDFCLASALDSFWRLNPNARLQLRRQRNCNALAFRLKSKKTKRLAASNISFRQALNC
jgi:hypothetical protein